MIATDAEREPVVGGRGDGDRVQPSSGHGHRVAGVRAAEVGGRRGRGRARIAGVGGAEIDRRGRRRDGAGEARRADGAALGHGVGHDRRGDEERRDGGEETAGEAWHGVRPLCGPSVGRGRGDATDHPEERFHPAFRSVTRARSCTLEPPARSEPRAPMDFRILGPLEALDGGRPVALGGSRQRALLALLLLHANEAVGSDRLIEELWGEPRPAGAAKTLQVSVSRLRKALAEDLVVTRGHGYELRLDPERLDAHRFAAGLARGAQRAGRGPAGARRSGARGGARPLARPAARRPGLRAVGAARDRAPPGPARRGVRAARRGQARARAPRGGARRARDADRGVPLPRGPAAPADARAVPLRPPGGCAAGLPGRAPHPRRGAGDRARGAAAGARGGDPRAGAGPRRAGPAAPARRRPRRPRRPGRRPRGGR